MKINRIKYYAMLSGPVYSSCSFIMQYFDLTINITELNIIKLNPQTNHTNVWSIAHSQAGFIL